MKVYIAAPKSSQREWQFSEWIDDIIRACGHETLLSHHDDRCMSDTLDCERMDWCDVILFLFDGRIPDEVTCFELGYCFAKGKRCIGYKTDARSYVDGFSYDILYGAPVTIFYHEDDLIEFFKKFSSDSSHNEMNLRECEEINEDSIIFADMDMALPIKRAMENKTISHDERPEILNLILDVK